MTGQVDEAGQERDLIHADLTDLVNALGMGDHARPYSSHQLMQEAIGNVRVLAGQVAAIRALHGKVPEPFLDGERYSCSTCTDGEGNAIDWPCPTLVASSPTTPEAKK